MVQPPCLSLALTNLKIFGHRFVTLRFFFSEMLFCKRYHVEWTHAAAFGIENSIGSISIRKKKWLNYLVIHFANVQIGRNHSIAREIGSRVPIHYPRRLQRVFQPLSWQILNRFFGRSVVWISTGTLSFNTLSTVDVLGRERTPFEKYRYSILQKWSRPFYWGKWVMVFRIPFQISEWNYC